MAITFERTRVIFLVCISAIIISTIAYFHSSTDRCCWNDKPFSEIPDVVTGKMWVEEISFDRTVDLNKQDIFNVMADVKNYPLVHPANILSVNILEQTENELLVEEEMIEMGIRLKFLVKHTLLPYEQHTIEIMDGDAKGTKFIQKFEEVDEGTKLSTLAEFKFDGVLMPFQLLPKSQLIHAMNSLITGFVIYAEESKSISEKTVDDLYREILKRPADIAGLHKYSSLLEDGKITTEEIRQELLDSEEYSVRSYEYKRLDELDENTKKTVDDNYREILRRSADIAGLHKYGSLLEDGKITTEEMRQELLDSLEYCIFQNLTLCSDVDKVFVTWEDEQFTCAFCTPKESWVKYAETKGITFKVAKQKWDKIQEIRTEGYDPGCLVVSEECGYPEPPINLTATLDPHTASQFGSAFTVIQVEWDEPLDNGNSAIRDYDMWRGVLVPTWWGGEEMVMSQMTTTGNVNAYTDHGALLGTKYCYEVSAINSIGYSYPTSTVCATTQDFPNPSLYPVEIRITDPNEDIIWTGYGTLTDPSLTVDVFSLAISVSTDKDYYQTGDIIHVTVKVRNSASVENIVVDANIYRGHTPQTGVYTVATIFGAVSDASTFQFTELGSTDPPQ